MSTNLSAIRPDWSSRVNSDVVCGECGCSIRNRLESAIESNLASSRSQRQGTAGSSKA